MPALEQNQRQTLLCTWASSSRASGAQRGLAALRMCHWLMAQTLCGPLWVLP